MAIRKGPATESAIISQRLIEAALIGDGDTVCEVLSNDLVDVNYIGTVNLRVKFTDSVQREEVADEVVINYKQFKTDITPLFAAAHSGHANILRRLLTARADVNQKLFKGYATTAAAREGHCDVLSILLKAGASRHACEDALLEACLFGNVKALELLISSEMIRLEVAANALVHASSRGLVDVVETLIKSGVDVDSWHRILLRSAKPSLHSSVDCTPLIAAVVGRQAAVVNYLLDAGAKVDCKARLGAWSWDSDTGEVLRVGAGMAEPYNAAWCAIEYWEAEGTIFPMLLKHVSPDSEHQGRTLIWHTVLCRNVAAAEVLLKAGANIEYRVCTRDGQEFCLLHLASRIGFLPMLKTLISYGCNLNAKTEMGETALMLCAIYGHRECFQELLAAGADFGIANNSGQSVVGVAESCCHGSFVHQVTCDAILAGQELFSSNLQVFSPLHFATRHGNVKALQKLLDQRNIDVNAQDKSGYSAAMIAAQEGRIEALKVLVLAGADINAKNKKGETVLTLAEGSGNKEGCESVILDATLANVFKGEDLKVLHLAARRGNTEVLAYLLKQGCSISALNEDEHTPLMVAAKEGHADICKFLLLQGADCHFVNSRGETALSLARGNRSGQVAEGVILDHVARKFVRVGEELLKHTKQGKGDPHIKMVRMIKSRVLSWGGLCRRNVLCKEAGLGPSSKFLKNTRRKAELEKDRIFRVLTTTGREVHFEAAVASHAELWVRGINLIIKDAIRPTAASG
eukprot:c28188_g3_i1 orf=387-2627(-)